MNLHTGENIFVNSHFGRLREIILQLKLNNTVTRLHELVKERKVTLNQ